jgi:hypothetical protein
MVKSVSTASLKMQKNSQENKLTASTVLLTTAYLAPVSYYAVLAKAENVLFENFDSYEKQTYRNRCQIATANGLMALSIPVEKSGSAKVLTRDIRISKHNNWQNQHWRAIESAYNSSPFFEYYLDDFLPFYTKDWTFLWDFNFEIQTKVLELLDCEIKMQHTNEYKKVIDKDITDFRNSFNPKIPKNIIETKAYYQVFTQRFGFQKDLSVIDLLFNMGNESQLVLKK